MGKSVAETKSKSKSESSSEESSAVEDSSAAEESDNESDKNESASEDEEQSDEESSNKRAHSDDEEEEEEERPKKTVKVEQPTEKKTFGAEGNTIWVGQINFDATGDDIRKHFSQCGEILDVRLRTEPQTGRSRGFAHIDFKTKEGKEAALKLNATEFMNRTLKVDNGKPATPRTVDNNFGPKTNTVFVANLAHSLDEDAVRQAFEKFGTIVGDIRLPWNRESGKIRGIGYIQYETEDQAEAAVKGMNGVVVEGRPIRTDYSGGDDSERVNNRPARGGFGGRGRGRGGRGRGGPRGGRGGPRGGSRGGRGGRGGRQ